VSAFGINSGPKFPQKFQKRRRADNSLSAFVTSEIARWTPMIKAVNVKAD